LRGGREEGGRKGEGGRGEEVKADWAKRGTLSNSTERTLMLVSSALRLSPVGGGGMSHFCHAPLPSRGGGGSQAGVPSRALRDGEDCALGGGRGRGGWTARNRGAATRAAGDSRATVCVRVSAYVRQAACVRARVRECTSSCARACARACACARGRARGLARVRVGLGVSPAPAAA
jgi:hypothetical protein